MMTTTYRYRMPWGETLEISADLTHASAPIWIVGNEDEGIADTPTPYQTADARHREEEMLRLVVEYLGARWYCTDEQMESEESRDQALDEAVEGAMRLEDEPQAE